MSREIMIRFKLHELMAQRKIFKISTLYNLTKKYSKEGIDRRMLTNMRNGTAKRIDTETLDILCKIFKCSLSDIMDFEKEQGILKKGDFKKT